jgi:anti-anti-sigma factor
METGPMELIRAEDQGVTVIGLAEALELDLGNSEAFKAEFLRLLNDADRKVVFDASNVTFFDSASMGTQLSVQKRLKRQGGQLFLAGLNRSVREVFQMVGFDMVFMTYTDVSSAVQSLK